MLSHTARHKARNLLPKLLRVFDIPYHMLSELRRNRGDYAKNSYIVETSRQPLRDVAFAGRYDYCEIDFQLYILQERLRSQGLVKILVQHSRNG